MSGIERVRFGGTASPDGFVFELTGGDVSLDLANTVDGRGAAEPTELLGSYADLVNWAVQTGLVDAAEARGLLRRAAKNPAGAARVLRRAIDLRETTFAIFGGAGVDDARLRKLQSWWEEAMRHRSLAREGGAVVWRWNREGLDRMLWPVAAAAASLLTSDTRSRVRVCAGDVCDWLFIDNSRRGNRRWCDMSVCGNRAKARRHYEKVRAGE